MQVVFQPLSRAKQGNSLSKYKGTDNTLDSKLSGACEIRMPKGVWCSVKNCFKEHNIPAAPDLTVERQ
jgi:hypothetical protein